MNKLFLYIFLILSLFPHYACKNNKSLIIQPDYKTYINNFELLQENSKNDTRVRIRSPKAIIEPTNNDIQIFDSSIEIIKKNVRNLKVSSENSTLNNFKNIITAYKNVNISLPENKNLLIKTDSLYWDLKTSIINFKNPLNINLENTKLYSANGIYNIDLEELKLNNNIFNRRILNKDGVAIYNIKIVADIAKWIKDNNSLEFRSNNKQVEATINFLSVK